MASNSRPGLDLPVVTTPLENSGPFMRVPREIRDSIYRFLLLTKHTRRLCPVPDRNSSRYTYKYHFQTSILFTSRQIYHEASDIFYMENLFIRVNSVMLGLLFLPMLDAGCRDYGFALPVSLDVSGVQACTRHVMEIDLIPDSPSTGHRRNHHFILACDDLPKICWHLLWMSYPYLNNTKLLLMELWITIGDEIGTTGMESIALNSSTSEKAAKYLNAACKNAAANCEGSTKSSEFAVERNAIIREGPKSHGNTIVNGMTEVKPMLSESHSLFENPRLRRLLEPLRALYNIGFCYIDAPISERYRQEIQTSLSKARPSIQDLFQMLLSAYEEANMTFKADYFDLAIERMIGTLEILYNLREYVRDDAFAEVATGPFAGYSLGEAFLRMQYIIWNNLTRAYLHFPKDQRQLRTAQTLARTIIAKYTRNDTWDQGAHEKAMTHYLEAEVWEALDQLGEHKNRPRSEALRHVVDMLKEALVHEPENPMLQQELERRQKEKETARIIERVREMEKAEGAVLSRERAARSARFTDAARLAKPLIEQ